MIRSAIYALLCLLLLAFMLVDIGSVTKLQYHEGILEFVKVVGLNGIAVLAIGALSLLVHAFMCFVQGARKGVPSIIVLFGPYLMLILTGVYYLRNQALTVDALLMMNREHWIGLISSGEQAALAGTGALLFWTASAFIGAALVGACARPNKDSKPGGNWSRWIAMVVGAFGCIGVLVALMVLAGPGQIIVSHSRTVVLASLMLLGLPVLLIPSGIKLDDDLDKKEIRRIAAARALGGLSLASAAICMAVASVMIPAGKLVGVLGIAVPEQMVDLSIGPALRAGLFVGWIIVIVGAILGLLTLAGGIKKPLHWIPAFVVTMIVLGIFAGLKWGGDRKIQKFSGPDLYERSCLNLEEFMLKVAMRDVSATGSWGEVRKGIDYSHLVTDWMVLPGVRGGTTAIKRSTSVAVDRYAIRVDNMKVLQIEEEPGSQGEGVPSRYADLLVVYPDEKTDLDERYLLEPVFKSLQFAVQKQCAMLQRNYPIEKKDFVTAFADENVDLAMVSKIRYSAAKSGYTSVAFAVIDPDGSECTEYRSIVIPHLPVKQEPIDPDACPNGNVRLAGVSGTGEKCACVYESGCVTVGVPGPECEQADKHQAELWFLEPTDAGLKIISPSGEEIVGKDGRSLAEKLRKSHDQGPPRRILNLDLPPSTTVAVLLDAWSTLLDPEDPLFAAGWIVGDPGITASDFESCPSN